MAYERFVDDRLLTSRDALNRTQIKIKLVEIDEAARDFSQRFGNRVLVRKILLTMRLTQTEEIEEKELNIEEIEQRIRKERLFIIEFSILASMRYVIKRFCMLLV